jgi:transglutaminase-like putative cysteine protease
MRSLRLGVVAGLLLSSAAWAADRGESERRFAFHYGATVTGLSPGQVAHVWLPVPSTNEDQTVEVLEVPEGARAGADEEYGNRMVYVERAATADGTVRLACDYRVQRRQVTGAGPETERAAEEAKRFLQADAKVPVGGKSLTLLAGKTLPQDPLKLGRLLYDVVDDHMTYRKDQPGWGTGDADWACDSKFGNCTDFHSLFISMARAEGLPAKFEMGFLVGPATKGEAANVPGYHCWAKFKPPGKDWVPVDISEANQHPVERDLNFGTLTANRVMFSVGRDLTLSPPQAGGPLNFFVYPYVEVEGKVWPQEKITKAFSYEDGAARPPGGGGAATEAAAGRAR